MWNKKWFRFVDLNCLSFIIFWYRHFAIFSSNSKISSVTHLTMSILSHKIIKMGKSQIVLTRKGTFLTFSYPFCLLAIMHQFIYVIFWHSVQLMVLWMPLIIKRGHTDSWWELTYSFQEKKDHMSELVGWHFKGDTFGI